jgi:hypothetical protein
MSVTLVISWVLPELSFYEFYVFCTYNFVGFMFYQSYHVVGLCTFHYLIILAHFHLSNISSYVFAYGLAID